MTAPLDLAALRALLEKRAADEVLVQQALPDQREHLYRRIKHAEARLAIAAPALLDFAAEAARLIANSECGVGPTGRSLLARLAGNGEAR